MDKANLAEELREIRNTLTNLILDEILGRVALNNLIIKKTEDGRWSVRCGDVCAIFKTRAEALIEFVAALARMGINGEA
jgi:hypothetical protein